MKIEINGKEREYQVFELTTENLEEIKRTPSFENAMDDDDNAFDSFNNYSGSSYICDAIAEIADNMTDIYNGDLWKNAANVSEYIEQAMAEGLVDTSSRDFTLERAFQAGEYEYYTAALYDNLDELCCNYILDQLAKTTICYVDYGENLNEDELLDLIIKKIDSVLDDYNADNNDRFWVLEEVAQEILDNVFEELVDEYEGLVIAIEDNFEDQLQEYIDENEEDEEEE